MARTRRFLQWSAPWALAFLLLQATAVWAQVPDPETLLKAVVRVTATVPPDSQSSSTLGSEREGTGVVIGGDGLIVTIGYTIMEASSVQVTTGDGRAYPADIVAYDHVSGFGLLRAGYGFDAPPVRLGDSGALKEGDTAVVLSRGGGSPALPTRVVSRREFAGYWEYMLDRAIFTSPPHPAFNGAALIDGKGRLVGIGSLIVGEAVPNHAMPGNMFVPVDVLQPILGDLLAYGRRQDPPRPWLGLTLREHNGRLLIQRVTRNSPAEAAGLRPGDQIMGLSGQRVGTLSEFYRRMWGMGDAGVAVPLQVIRGPALESVTITSGDRTKHLKLNPTF
ncbi:serine protease [Azospirillum sp. RWY-5-1]|uniref:Serine protease n=1 Tax=Azospirillum oleiclasticum TaxID=2735135 RepID=A0ABX2T579_9PROT|nr:S1C family serine protease [Azospirillum oleiclasticum]NYZ12082.1 serine protease [Azospirillum oleiclasticum]NYZ19242.1 serine protease [Azospirillum oleiclasticum]